MKNRQDKQTNLNVKVNIAAQQRGEGKSVYFEGGTARGADSEGRIWRHGGAAETQHGSEEAPAGQ